jgi:glycosyltransferase involved in cell wall biosynthesis
MTRQDVTVVIPTYNRPDSLYRAVESLFWQGARKSRFSVLIADNSADASARMTYDTLAARTPDGITLSYIHVPDPGVANARNAAMDALETRLVAFLDDDQTAPIHWIESLLLSYDEFGAAATFGPVLTALPDDVTDHKRYFEAFFARDPALSPGFIDKPFGCGNCLLDIDQMPAKPWFDTRMNDVGGEDDLLFARLRKAEKQFCWAAGAPVYEHPLRQRITLSYTLKRAFAYGQGPCTLALRAEPPRYLSLVKWMAIGAGKFALNSAAWLALTAIRHPGRAFALDRAVRGLGKVLFWKSFRFYGTATVSQAVPEVSLGTDPAEPGDTRGSGVAAS